MARPQSPDYDKRRAAIVATAARLYARRGFQGASVAELAKACKTSKSLVYHYFPSKEDVLHEVMTSHLELLVEAADEVVQSSAADPRERLRALARSWMRLYAGAADSHKVLLNELDNLPPDRRVDVVDKQRRIIRVVEDQLTEMRPELGESPQLLPLAMLFFGMINWTHTWFRPEGELTPDAVADLAARLMLEGLDGATRA
jgi:AcrR family transcriptional regulator